MQNTREMLLDAVDVDELDTDMEAYIDDASDSDDCSNESDDETVKPL